MENVALALLLMCKCTWAVALKGAPCWNEPVKLSTSSSDNMTWQC